MYIQYQNNQFFFFFTLLCELFTSCNVSISNDASLVSARTVKMWSTKCGQAWTGGGGGPKNSQIFADILYEWPYTRMYTNKHVYLCIYTCIHIKREENNKEKRNQRSTSGLSKPLVVSIKLIVWRSIFLIYNLNIQPAFACSNSTP